jgi:hypothetical protein
MNLKLFLAFSLLIILYDTDGVQAQSPDIVNFNQQHRQINKTGMLTLGIWALSNFAVNGSLLSGSQGDLKYFYQGNIYWNLVNLGLAGFGYIQAADESEIDYTLNETLNSFYGDQKLFLFNAGLDLAYVAGGFFLKEKAKTAEKRSEMFKGFGNALILQGGYLFVFDLVMYFIHQVNVPALNNLLFTNNGIGFVIKFH